MWMGGSYSIYDAEITGITSNAIHIEADVKEGQTSKKERVVISLDSDPVQGMIKSFPTLPPIDPMRLNHASKLPIDNFCRRMTRLCNIVKAYEATGKMIQMGVQLGGKGVGKLVSFFFLSLFSNNKLETNEQLLGVIISQRNDMYLNQVPHSEYHQSIIRSCFVIAPQ